MKTVLWILFFLSALVFLIGVFAKLGVHQAFNFAPVAWWRGAMGIAVYTLVLAKLTENKS